MVARVSQSDYTSEYITVVSVIKLQRIFVKDV